MTLHLFAGVRVRDFQEARPWYERLLGEPTFFPHATQAVWTLAEVGFRFADTSLIAPGGTHKRGEIQAPEHTLS